jgi:predicted alpha/beta hydrolase
MSIVASVSVVKTAYKVTAEDGHSSDLVVFAPSDSKSGLPVVLIHPALGTPAGYYFKLAESLSSRNNWVVAVTELRGNGSSSWRASRKVNWAYWTVPSIDIPANVKQLRSLYPTGPFYLMGHSIGGIMLPLYLAKLQAEQSSDLDDIAGIVIIASGSLYYKTYPKPSIWWIAWLVILMSYLFGYFPGKLMNFGGKAEARGLMLDWAREIRTGVCQPVGCPHPNIAQELKKLKKPALLVSFDKDSFVPHESTARLASFFDETHATHIKIDPNEHEELKDLNKTALHFKWARGEMILPIVENYLKPHIEKHNTRSVSLKTVS